ncbi:MAG: aspartate/glutamate racemase family protein [Bacteroidales bacterium]|nr:aspartate/glutamate racemase family protein [Bacteroidales bacterium]
MKTIGLIGGMSWESSLEYYRIINQEVKHRLGGLHSSKSLMYSVEFDEIQHLQHIGDWDSLTRIMIDAGKKLEKGGADFIVICTNTMHRMFEDVQANVSIPLLHIADATAQRIKANGINTIALLGTKFTMEQDFYKGRLLNNHGINVIIPNEEDRNTVHSIIYNELCQGQINQPSREQYIRIIEKLKGEGAEGVILGCTEIPLLIKQADVSIPTFDTTRIHAEMAVTLALKA